MPTSSQPRGNPKGFFGCTHSPFSWLPSDPGIFGLGVGSQGVGVVSNLPPVRPKNLEGATGVVSFESTLEIGGVKVQFQMGCRIEACQV